MTFLRRFLLPWVGLVFMLVLPSVLRAEVRESFDLDTYEVDQEEGETLLQAINSESPIRECGRIFHGYTKWFIKWNFRWWEEENGSCRITEVTTSLDVAMTMPELDEATPQGAAVFKQYAASLRLHEDGHRDIAQKAAAKIDAGIPSHSHRCRAVSRSTVQRTSWVARCSAKRAPSNGNTMSAPNMGILKAPVFDSTNVGVSVADTSTMRAEQYRGIRRDVLHPSPTRASRPL